MPEGTVTADARVSTDAELRAHLVAMRERRARLDGEELAFLAELDTRCAYVDDGAANAGTWLAHHGRTSGNLARSKVRVARRLAHMPLTAAAFEAAEIGFEQVRILAGLRHGRTEEAFDRDEAILVDAAREFGVDDLVKVAAHWRRCADPDGVSGDTAKQWARRHAHLVKTFDGAWHLSGLLDAESGEILHRAWQAIVEELRELDRKTALADPQAPVRTHAQREADALIEMARRAAACDTATTSPARPEVVVIIDHDDLVRDASGSAEFDDGIVVSGDIARRMACDASYVRAVTLGRSEILDLGRSTPVPSAAQRRAIMLRDGGCFFPGCDRPLGWCDIHHFEPVERGKPTGGPTDLHNLGPVCRQHHHHLHEGGYTAQRDPTTGHVIVRRPDGTTIQPTTLRASPLGRRYTRRPPDPARDDAAERWRRQNACIRTRINQLVNEATLARAG